MNEACIGKVIALGFATIYIQTNNNFVLIDKTYSDHLQQLENNDFLFIYNYEDTDRKTAIHKLDKLTIKNNNAQNEFTILDIILSKQIKDVPKGLKTALEIRKELWLQRNIDPSQKNFSYFARQYLNTQSHELENVSL